MITEQLSTEEILKEKIQKIIDKIFNDFNKNKDGFLSTSEFKDNFKTDKNGVKNSGSEYRNLLNKYMPDCIEDLKNSKLLYIEANTNIKDDMERTRIDQVEFAVFLKKYIDQISIGDFSNFEKEVFGIQQ